MTDIFAAGSRDGMCLRFHEKSVRNFMECIFQGLTLKILTFLWSWTPSKYPSASGVDMIGMIMIQLAHLNGAISVRVKSSPRNIGHQWRHNTPSFGKWRNYLKIFRLRIWWKTDLTTVDWYKTKVVIPKFSWFSLILGRVLQKKCRFILGDPWPLNQVRLCIT